MYCTFGSWCVTDELNDNVIYGLFELVLTMVLERKIKVLVGNFPKSVRISLVNLPDI